MNSLLNLIGKYLIGLLGIALVVVIHEIGHLIAARACKIDVEVFSFGLGPKLWSTDHKGTDFRISLFPSAATVASKARMTSAKHSCNATRASPMLKRDRFSQSTRQNA